MPEFDETMRRYGRVLRGETAAQIDVDADLSATLSRCGDSRGAIGGTEAAQRTNRLAIAATILAVLGLGAATVFAIGRDGTGDETASPGDAESSASVSATTPNEPSRITTDVLTAPETRVPSAPPGRTTEPDVAAIEPLPETTFAPEADPAGCLSGLEPDEAAEQFGDLFAGSRALGDFDVIGHCTQQLPEPYDADASICWNTCDVPPRLIGPFTTSESFNPNSGETIRRTRVAVQYVVDLEGMTLDVVETWRLIRLEDGTYRVDDFRIESPVVERERSAETIRTYLNHIESGAWQDAAEMLNDGAVNLDKRADLQRLATAGFDVGTIAAGLDVWCKDGCDVEPFDADDLQFDGNNYRLQRRGESIFAAWFEGEYSISGLPIRTGEPLDPADFRSRAAEILDDGTVDREEYVESFEFLAACANSRGADLDLDQTDPSGTQFLTSIPGESIAAYDACYPAVQQIDAAYQTAETTYTQGETFYASRLDCLRSRGVDVEERAQRALDERNAVFEDTPREPMTLDELDSRDIALFVRRPNESDGLETIRALLICNPLPR